MCGIAGFVRTDGARADAEELERMVATLDHRGPDARGHFVAGPVALGHTRLAIIDVEGGAQPMHGDDGRVSVVFNGEIYNHHELRAELEDGERFRTRSDTEVLVRGYARWGEGLIERLGGFFAFAVWDEERQSLLLARDRIGKKPLYWARLGGRLLFASEPRALLAVWEGTPEPDPRALDEILAVRHPLGRRTGFEGIEQLQPGEWLRFEDGRVSLHRYWTPPEPTHEPMNAVEAVEEFRARFDEAVRCRLEADVPLGVMLSGGNDSTCVLESMARCATGPIRTFTVAFSRGKESEAGYARLAARRFGTEHEEFLLSERDLVDHVERLLPSLDAPMADPSILPTALVARTARQRVTVCLTGDGGDELFGGYSRYAQTLARAAQTPPGPLARRVMERLLPHVPRYGLKSWKLARRMRRRLASPEALYVDAIGCVEIVMRAALLGERARGRSDELVEARLVRELAGDGGLAERMMHLDLRHFLPELILHKVDRASMLSSLETRSPFLDHRLIDWSQRVPVEHKLGPGGLKLLVKRALEGRVPRELLTRGKMGFGTPLGRWFRRELSEYLRDHLGASRLARDGWLEQRELDRMLSAHRTRARNLGEALWTLLVLEVWYRTWLAPA